MATKLFSNMHITQIVDIPNNVLPNNTRALRKKEHGSLQQEIDSLAKYSYLYMNIPFQALN